MTEKHEDLLTLVAKSVAERCGTTAVIDNHETTSYVELSARSDDWAATLAEVGVSPEEPVVVHLDRGAEMIAAVLGVLKAGGAFVPIDRHYSPDRQRQLAEITNARVIVSDCPDDWTDDRWTMVNSPLVVSNDPVRPVIDSARAACVLFTSGSAGVPKAVVLEHRQLAAFATNAAMPGLHPSDVVGQVSSVSFDAFNFEIWSALVAGATVAVLPPIPDLLAAGMAVNLAEHRVTAMLLPTMAFHHIIQQEPDALSVLRVLLVGGDVCPPASCRALLSSNFEGRLFNLYGPTETTIACAMHEVRDAALAEVPIGASIDGVRLHLLGDDLTEVPGGTKGELHIAGVGLARGYLGAPGRTAEVFLPDPFGPAGSRMYRTGDLARLGSDGALEFVGRVDRQVKIRGYRVEPEDVASQLEAACGVTNAAVVPLGDGPDRRLAALVVPESGADRMSITRRCAEVMPWFMVPSLIIETEELPRTENGKRDWSLIIDLLSAGGQQQSVSAAELTTTEREVAKIWLNLLDAEALTPCSDFYQLGGNSLLAFRMVREIATRLHADIELRDVSRYPALGDLASRVDTKRRTEARR